MGSSGACLTEIAILILLNTDETVLISNALEELQKHLHDLKSFCVDKNLSINLYKTEVMMFNITQAWVSISSLEFLLGEEKAPYTRS